MAISSRRSLLPREPEKIVTPLWILLFILFAWSLPVLLGYPVSLDTGIFLMLLTVAVALYVIDRVRLRRIAEKRKNDSICSFARDFDYRKVDTLIIRAVYEEMQHSCKSIVPNFPVRAVDLLKEDLDLDLEDLDDMAAVIAARTQRVLDKTDQNPFYDKVKTVSDLVMFLSHQPLKT